MKKIHNQIIKLYCEIIFILIFIMVSFVIFLKTDAKKYGDIAYAYSHLDEKLELDVNSSLGSIAIEKDKNTYNKNTITLKVNNNINMKKEYTLYLKYNINSTLKDNNIKINIDNKILKLKDLDKFTKGASTYYVITTDKIKPYTINTHKLHLYLDENTTEEELNKTLDIDFLVEEI